MATIKSTELRPTDSELFSEISDEAQALIVGGGEYTTVIKGDTLSDLAYIYCGKASKWPQIYKANKRVIGSNPNLIKPGQRLYIPCA